MQDRISTVFEPDMMCPAVSQGAIGVECRADDAETIKLLESINNEPTWHCVETERAFLDHLGGSCHTPIAGFVEITKGGNLRLIGLVASEDGKQVLRTRHKMGYDEWQDLANAAASDLMDQGAEAIIAATHK
jgi:hydroxymethylbilane synthase